MNKVLRSVLIIVLSAVLIWSLASIGLTMGDYKKADVIYEKSRNESFHIMESTPEVPVANIAEEYFPEVTVDFEALTKANPEVIGWLWIPDTEINFPLLRTENNWKYLSLSYDLQRTNSGSIFMDYRNSAELTDNNTVIYGHNMKSGGMFGALKEFADEAYLAEHAELYIFKEDSIYKYRIFSAYKTEADSSSYTRNFSDDFSFEDFVSFVSSCSGETITDPPQENSPVVTLSTCTSGQRSERFVVHAYLVSSKSTKDNPSDSKTE